MGNYGSSESGRTVVVCVELGKVKAGAWHDQLVLVGAHDDVGWDPLGPSAIAFVPCTALSHAKHKKSAAVRYVAVVPEAVLKAEHKLALRTSPASAAAKAATLAAPAAPSAATTTASAAKGGATGKAEVAASLRWEPLPGVMSNRPAVSDSTAAWPCLVMRWGDYANTSGSKAQAQAAREACGVEEGIASTSASSAAGAVREEGTAGGAGRGPDGRRPSDGDPAADDGVVLSSAADVDAVDDGNAYLKPVDYAADSKAYAARLGPMQLRSMNISAPASGHPYHFRKQLDTPADRAGAGAGSSALKRVLRELRDIKKSAALPLEPGSSVFLRYDKAKPTALQALIIGPPDTPYSGGCFLFDIYVPETYPTTPPKVNLATTGGGSVRFNPNLYNSGYVCLSLLGTWTGDNASQNWQPGKSTVLQVLVSIQAEIMGVQFPVYNEPGMSHGSGDSDMARTSANGGYERLRVATMQWAMVDMLRKPPAGFEDVVRAHFSLRKDAIRATCDTWAKAAAKSNTAGHKDALKAQRTALEGELRKL